MKIINKKQDDDNMWLVLLVASIAVFGVMFYMEVWRSPTCDDMCHSMVIGMCDYSDCSNQSFIYGNIAKCIMQECVRDENK